MKHAAVEAIAQLARDPPSDVGGAAYDSGETQGFGPGSLIPSPFDPRLILRIAPAVAKAAMDPASRRGRSRISTTYTRSWSASRSAPASS
jgi:malic enzyme